ncbi:MAG: hypothetical protein H6613_04425 [Ignavibacteriales bacterium]|nr:hypothetical protein [Ignavibacteriota bacterium]MCB9247826.1 hypothetical protein [Ignavibacteriales bacterium]
MKISEYIILFSTVLLLLSCEENIITECEEAQNTASLTTFNSIQINVFDQSCAFSGCHAGSNPQANLLLTSGNSYSKLVNVTSILNPSFKLVQPGNSENSFLIKMLKHTGESTSQMPPAGKLSEGKIDSIAAWINRGAINN